MSKADHISNMEDWQSSIQKTIYEIEILENSVRKHINTHRYQTKLIKNSANWNQICSSLDTIGDICYLISDYMRSEYPKEVGLKYLFTYGLLQSLFVQQDAIMHLCEAFGIKHKRSDRLQEIRLIRAASIGHPTKNSQNPDKKTYYNYISRPSLSHKNFNLIRSCEGTRNQFIQVDLYPIIYDHLNEIELNYQMISNTLKEADQMHKEKYKGTAIVDIFPSSMNYFFQKIAQAINSPDQDNMDFGSNMLGIIKETYSKFETHLKDRGDLDSYTQHDLDEYNHALSRLDEYFQNKTDFSEQDASICLFYIEERHKHFEALAKEIDQSYENSQKSA